MSSRDDDEQRVMHSRSNNIELMINDGEDKAIILSLFVLICCNTNAIE